MRKTIILGVIFDVIAVIGLVMIVVIPILPGAAENPTVLKLMAALVCQPGETATIKVVVTQDSDGTGYTPHVTCIGREGERTDQTVKLFIIAGVTFLVPLLLGILLINVGARRVRAVNRARSTIIQDMARIITAQGAASSAFNALDAGLSPDFNGSSGQSNTGGLVAKLKQLETARDAGLITQSEYDRLRQDILDKLA